jgi:hypothetical protein
MHIRRRLQAPGKSFLLLGPRGTGKSTWLAETLPQALTIDLLDSSRFLELSSDPTALARHSICSEESPRSHMAPSAALACHSPHQSLSRVCGQRPTCTSLSSWIGGIAGGMRRHCPQPNSFSADRSGRQCRHVPQVCSGCGDEADVSMMSKVYQHRARGRGDSDVTYHHPAPDFRPGLVFRFDGKSGGGHAVREAVHRAAGSAMCRPAPGLRPWPGIVNFQ